jgi:arylsulfatase A-like enzyme
MPRARTAVAAALVLGAVACARGPEPPLPPAGIALRFIAEESAEVPSPDRLFASEPVFRFSFASADERARWRLRDAAAAPGPEGRLVLETTGPAASLERPVQFDADDVDRIELRLAGQPSDAVELSWATSLQRFTSERTIVAEPGETPDGAGRSCRFDLRGHPWWTGRIDRLRIAPVSKGGGRLALLSLEGSRRAADAARLASAAARAWKAELAHDARNALLGPPGQPVERRLIVPAGAALHFGYGLEPGARTPVRFEVTVTEDGAPPRRLFSRRLDPRRGGGGRWYEATVPLDDLAGRPIAVRLTTRAGPAFDPTRGVPMWANPEVTGGPPPDRPNVVLVCLDTLRADRLSSYGYARATSPRLDAWAAGHAALFRTVVATSPWTLPSHVSMFSGLDAVRHGVNHFRPAPPSLEMLAERFRSSGYTTAAITGGGYLRPQFGFAQGFDRFVYWPERDTERELASGIERAFDWIERERGRPFFLFFHTYEVHYPHLRRQPFFDRLAGASGATPPAAQILMQSHGWRGLRAPGDYFLARHRGEPDWHAPLSADENELVNLMYDSGVAYADAQVGRLIDHLASLGLADRTVLIVTSDHGEALGEDDRAGHSYLEDYNVLVPLLVGLPNGRGAGATIDRQVRLTDLAPTIVDAAGLGADLGDDGVSLLHLIDGEPARVPDRAWTYAPAANRGLALRLTGRLKYTYNDTAWEQLRGEERLVDLDRDPAEHHNLAAEDPRTVPLRAEATAALSAQHRGPRIVLRNAGPQQLRGELYGALTAHDRVKAGGGDGTVRWRNERRPTFVLGPGQELTLLLTSPDRNKAGIGAHLVAADGRRSARIVEWFDLSQLERPLAMALDGEGAWRRLDSPQGPPATGFMVWWEGGVPEDAVTGPPAADAATLDQLRALGYLE